MSGRISLASFEITAQHLTPPMSAEGQVLPKAIFWPQTIAAKLGAHERVRQ